jgi:hypothetical protein
MKKLAVSLIALAVACAGAVAADDAREMITKARAVAAKEGKNVLITFHASW